MRWTKAVTVAACLAAGAAFAQSSTTGGTATPDKSTDTSKSDTYKSDPGKMDSKSTAKDPKAAQKGTSADKDKDTSATGTGGSSTTPDTTKK